ncbi:hypothetical protein LCGC14_2280120 [marine sediment metagenome]|uniref:Uncharacterized protein n=1 Tax=marine sediment metagenome TaxID=412755 RepID=A0A0F9CUA0_9ZZZZ
MKTHTLQVKRAMLVYQGGIANVFAVDSYNLADSNRNAKRLFQGSFDSAVQFAAGLATAGAGIKTAACNMAGDIANQLWTDDIEDQPFSARFVHLDINNRGYSD